MAITEQGEARWKAFRYARVVLKFFQLVFPPICLALATTFKSVSYIHLQKSTDWVNITLKFPFYYDAKKTIFITNSTAPPGMTFAPEISVVTWIFTGVQCLAFLMAVLMLMSYVCTHGNTNMDSVARADAIISIIIAVCLAVVSGLWIYHIVALERNVYSDIDRIYTKILNMECVKQKRCIKFIANFSQLYAAAGASLFSVILWILGMVEAARYGLTSVLFFRQDVTGILEMNPDIGDVRA